MNRILKIAGIICLLLISATTLQAKSPYSLNVIYFLPKGDAPVEGFENRLNDLLLYTQEFYRKEMKRNGFGNKTFGLSKTPQGKVKIVVVRGKEDIPFYSYDNGGGWKAEKEIEAYFKEHPGEKGSGHALVIMPSTSGDDMNPGGVPFYGIGKYCFALDYKYFDIKYLGQDTPEGHLLTKWFGGMAHELGHGLNLPHNMQQVTEEKMYGTALMGAGNHTFGLKPTYLTKASCAILNNCEVFAEHEKKYYDPKVEFDLNDLDISFTKDQIVVKGDFKSLVPVNGVNVYIDHAPYGQVNNDYDAESWTVKSNKGNFMIAIPRSELHDQKIDGFQVRVKFLFENGNSQNTTADFVWSDLKTYHFIKQ